METILANRSLKKYLKLCLAIAFVMHLPVAFVAHVFLLIF